jgi:hypothetical protein
MTALSLALALAVLPEFSLRDPTGGMIRIKTSEAEATVVIFVSAVCPMSGDYVSRINGLSERYESRRVRLVLVNSNQDETDASIQRQRVVSGLRPVVHRDPGARVATALAAYVTPTAVVLDRDGATLYWGAIDDSRTPDRVKREYLATAVDEMLAAKPVTVSRTKVMGCSIAVR